MGFEGENLRENVCLANKTESNEGILQNNLDWVYVELVRNTSYEVFSH